MWDGILVDWRIRVRLRSRRHPISTRICIWTSPGRPRLLSLYSCACCCSQRSRRFLLRSWQQTSCPLSLCPPAGALWVTGSQRRSVIVLESCHWPRYDGSGTESIDGTPIEYLHPFANEVWQGIHTWSRRRAAGCVRRWACRLDETARSRKSAGYSSSPLSPETTPVALCQQLTGFLERVQPTSGKHRKAST